MFLKIFLKVAKDRKNSDNVLYNRYTVVTTGNISVFPVARVGTD